ncbi:MAG: signal peptidase I [Dysgonomonas sp.]|nr:signal peptidase I [Dysgonomonas sp.]
MSSKKKNIYAYLGKVILITLLIVLLIRTFLIEPYTIMSTQMEDSLVKGDRVLIDKTAYGIRLPITLLSIPFTFDSFWGVKSYSTAIEFPYKRMFERKVKQNDIILFNNPTEIDRPLDKRSLIISRCVAIGGDSVQLKDGYLYINGKSYVSSPDQKREYVSLVKDEELDEVLAESEISISGTDRKGDSVFAELSKFEAFALNEYLLDSLHFKVCSDSIITYNFLVPAKGSFIDANSLNLNIYKRIILEEQGGKAKIENDKLYIDNVFQSKYIFSNDYYWVVSDNMEDAIDSRSLGFIPFANIIGKANVIWYSADKERWFTKIEN